ncbi:response regulator transcription factor [Altericista sp. CCNU0014]|uniref:response regulator transcription factor n=1 Tax=Altericista sp. CCNU0014 TaxID=3082949 RepID=UPI00384E2C68
MAILLVDDEVELTEPLCRALKREGYAVEVAYDGETALKMIWQQQDDATPYELLILDWMLPKQSGIELCQKVRSRGDTTPVLFLTAKDTLDARVQGLDAGADDYLVKPFELRELLARVRALLRRGELLGLKNGGGDIIQNQRIVAEGLELDIENQVAYRNGRAIALSEKECRLLAFLMLHPQLLTHEEIYRNVWPLEEKPTSNVLAAHIRLLRRKIEDSQELPLIRTIYGKGYRFGTNASE